jgi:hypothetical protein
MLTRINSVVGLALVLCVSCASHSTQTEVRGSQSTKATPSTFLNASPDTHVWVSQVTNQNGRYVLVYSEDKKKGVVLDVEKQSKGDLAEVRNIGFGTDAGNGQWNLYNEGENGVIYESQGGEWTLRNFAALLTEGLKEKQKRIRFSQVNHFVADFR